MDLDYLLRCGDAELTVHHVAAVPDAPMFRAHLNTTNTTEGGCAGSKMRTKYLRRAEADFKACFREYHVLNIWSTIIIRFKRASCFCVQLCSAG